MRPSTILCSSYPMILFSFHAYARRNVSNQYIALDVNYGTPDSPCINSFNGWSPSLADLKDSRKCYGIEGDHDITCISRRVNRLNDDEKMLSTKPLDCTVKGYSNNHCSGLTYWPAEFNANNQTWLWVVWNQIVGTVDIGSFGITCR